MLNILESHTVKHAQRTHFGLKRVTAAIALVLASQMAVEVAQAGPGFGAGVKVGNTPNAVPTYYANSPAGPVPVLTNGVPTIRTDGSGLPVLGTTGTALRKFVDPLQLFGTAKANAAGQYIPVAAPEKWVDTNGIVTSDDYYEIAAVEYTQQLHSDLPKATHLRGYVQLETPSNFATSKHIALAYPDGTAIQKVTYVAAATIDAAGTTVTVPAGTSLAVGYTVSGGGFATGTAITAFTAGTVATATAPAVPATFTTAAPAAVVAGISSGPGALQASLTITGGTVFACDTPHHLGPVINATKGTAVRVKFTNYLPIYGGTTKGLFLPVDTTIPGAGLGPDGLTPYPQNRAGIHVLGAQGPWTSAGTPHQWVAPAGEIAAYAAGIGKGASTQNAPDMADPGPGSVTLYYPNNESARFTFFRDETSGIARLNAYAGLAGGYKIVDPVEQTLINGGTVAAGTGALTTALVVTPPSAAGVILPADELPLIFEDKTFVPANVAQQDALWNNANWGTAGDLWFPHVYEPNQDPTQADGTNPVGRWDYGALFWPIFPVSPDKATLPSPSYVPESYMDTLLVNGTAYPTVTVDPKAYRLRLANASNDRYLNLGFYVADPTVLAPVLDANGNPMLNAAGAQLLRAGTEVKIVPAAPIDTLGSPPGWDVVNGVQTPLPQFTSFPWHIVAEPSGPTRAWPVDGRVGGTPDPATSGPDFIVIGNDGGFLPGAVDIPSQPITYEQNRRSITVTNIYGYGMLLGPGERADTIVDFTPYQGKTLILYNDAPAPTPFIDARNDYYTGDPDNTALGGTYTTQPGYGPNTRTVLQVLVNASNTSGTGGPLNEAGLLAALPAAYAATQPSPLVTQVVYNTAFGTNNPDTFARVATGSAAQPNLTFSGTGTLQLTGLQLVTSGGTGTGSGSGYATPPAVVINGGGGTGALAHAYVGTSSTGTIVNNGTTSATVTIADTGILGVGAPVSGGGFPAGTVVTAVISPTTFTTSAAGTAGAGAALTFGGCQPSQVCGVVLDSPGTGYTSAPNATFVSDNSVASVSVVAGGSGFATTDTVAFTGGGGSGATGTLKVSTTSSISPKLVSLTGGAGYTVAPLVTFVPAAGNTPTQTAVANATLATSTLILGANATLGNTTVTVTAPGVNYTAPKAVVSAPQVAGTTATATPVVGFAAGNIVVPAAGIAPTNGATQFETHVDSVSGNTVSSAIITFSAPQFGTDVALGTVTVDTSGTTLHGLVTAINITHAGSGYVTAPTATIADTPQLLGATQNTATVAGSLAAGTGQIVGANLVNPGSGYTAAATITFTDTTGTGASATAKVSQLTLAGGVLVPNGIPSTTPVGVVTGLAFSNAGQGYTAAPTVQFADAAGFPVAVAVANATVQLTNAAGAITGVTITSHGAGYTSLPTAVITTTNGLGANLVPVIGVTGVGAQATVLTTTSKSYPTLTKAEQELFDDYGRYNATGGVELPYTTATIQTTIPLNYLDAPTEVIGDGEVQVWKLVDNGLWTNSIHFNSANVQLINRVGWDGTVKAPANNEVGWRDTLRLNPLEDVIVAVQGVRSQAGFGQPRSTRLQDPTTPAGTPSHPAAPAPAVAGTRYVPGLGFTADPNVVQQSGLFATGTGPAGQILTAPSTNAALVPVGTQLLTAAANTNVLPASPTGNFDNEFLWGSAIMGHGTDDLQRPVVFNPVVMVPDAPSALADTLGNGVLTWVDPTPGAVSPGNPKNEVGFAVLQAPVKNGVAGTFAPFANVPANTVNFNEPTPLVSPTPPNGQFYAYAVVGYNAAGVSLVSNVVIEAPPAAPTNLVLTPGFIAGATSPNDILVNLQWTDNATNESNFILTRKGPAATQAALATAVAGTPVTLPANPGTGADTYVDNGPLVEGAWYEYDLVARNAFGDSAPVLTGQVLTPAPLAAPTVTPAAALTVCPTNPLVPVRCAPDDIVLGWTDPSVLTGYTIDRTGGPAGTTFAQVVLPATAATWTDKLAQEGYTYTYTVTAVRAQVGGAQQTAPSSLAVTTVINTPTLPTNVVVTPSTALDAKSMYVDQATITFRDNAYTDTGYNIYRAVGSGATAGAPVLVGTVAAGTANNPWGTKSTGWTASPTLSFTDGIASPLVDGQTYTWTVQAVNNATTATGNTLTSAAVVATMPGILINPPTNLTATPNRTGSSINLCWTDASSNETDFLVEESLSTTGGTNGTFGAWATPAGSPVNRTAAQTTATGAQVCFGRGNVPTTPGYVYNFRISARNLANHSDSHPYVTITANLNAPSAPAAVVLQAPVVTATATGGERVALTWNKLTPAAGTALTYQVYANGLRIATVAQPALATATTVTFRYNVPLATTAQTISYTVVAVATAVRPPVGTPQTIFGSTSGPASNAASATVPAAPANALPAPTGITSAVNATTGAVTLSWTAVGGAPTGATVSYRASVNGAAAVTLASGGVLNVARGAIYQVQVATAFTLAGRTTIGAYSVPVLVNTLPAQSTGLSALAVTTSATGATISVNWANVSTNITGWTIQRGVTGTAGVITWTTIAPTLNPVAGTTYGFTDTVTGLGTYSYRVLATSAVGNTAYVTSGAVTTPLSAPTGITPTVNAATGAVTLSWTAVTPPAGGTVSYRVSVNGGIAVPLASGGALNVAAGAAYSVQVATAVTVGAVTTIGAYSTPVTVNTLPAQSTGVTNALAATPARTFNVGFNNTSTNITGWVIQRGVSTTAAGAVTWTTIAVTPTATGTAYTFSNTVAAAGFYRFRIQATSAAGSTAIVTTPTVNTP
jgi:hypothetical protein